MCLQACRSSVSHRASIAFMGLTTHRQHTEPAAALHLRVTAGHHRCSCLVHIAHVRRAYSRAARGLTTLLFTRTACRSGALAALPRGCAGLGCVALALQVERGGQERGAVDVGVVRQPHARLRQVHLLQCLPALANVSMPCPPFKCKCAWRGGAVACMRGVAALARPTLPPCTARGTKDTRKQPT